EGATGRKAKVGHGGSFKQDDRGFVYYDPTTHRMNILVHGSRNADDWDANFDGELVPLTNYGYSFEEVGHAMVHRGFANIAFATMEDLEKQIMTILSMTDNPNKILGSLVINTFGHSQSGPVAQMMAFFLATKFAKKLYGADYDNTTFNHVRSIAFSAARPGNAAFADLFNRVVGNQNAIRVNVHGDPVPLTGPSEGFAAVLKPVAQAAELWATYLPVLTPKVMQEKLFEEGVPLSERIDAMKGAKGVGTLALDPAGDALVRNLARKEVAQAALRAAGQDLVSGFAELDPREVARNASEAWNEGRRGGGNVVLATAKAAQSIAKSAVQPILGLAAGVVDLVKGIAAPIHYGSVESSANGAYDPKNVSDDPNALLKNGFVHEQAKAKAAKAAEEKAQASYWSTVKGWFGY
ncbi:MAG: lipase family protein, partial [Holosporales bacterium]